ncbi:MAG: enolase C-terminal domain-like protein [Nanoarchaeota archaeon]
MVCIKEVFGREILDSRKEKTILVSVKINTGKVFSASAPSGKSKGKFEKKPYKKTLKDDTKRLSEMSDYFKDEEFSSFDDLKKIEDICDGHIGANSMIAFEYAVLKAIAYENKKQVWQIVNFNKELKKNKELFFIGNIIGGGKHSKEIGERKKKPDFQEFLAIVKAKEHGKLKKAHEIAKEELEKIDDSFEKSLNDENAWETGLNEKLVLDILYKIKKELNIDIGIDVAGSGFYGRKKYHYLNPRLDREEEEQLNYIENLIKNYGILYIEDAFDEEDFKNFALLRKKFPDKLIVGDDLTVTNVKRFKKAIKEKSISGIIIKPNQIGSLIEVKEVVELAKKNNIKVIFSHRSGETEEDILADLALGFQADYLKCGIQGREREVKIKRVLEILRGILFN